LPALRWHRFLLGGMTIAAVICAAAAPIVDPALPIYRPQALTDAADTRSGGPIAIVGYNDMRDLLEPLVNRFSATHDGMTIVLDLPATRLAPEALASGRSVLAPMGAELTPPQAAAYRAVAGHEPIEVRVAHASLDPRALSGPLAIFVHADNPLAALSIDQLSLAYTGRAKTWGELGAGGDWSDRPIHLRGLRPGTALAYFMQRVVLADAAFTDTMIGVPQSAEVVRDVGADPLSIGFAAAMRTQPGVRMVAVSPQGSKNATLPTVETVSAGTYPLDRHLLVYARRPLTPFAREFLLLMLSREGQEAVAATPQRYLPLSAAQAARERAKLDLP
jgi:phosphate transport system substrate-binding protein